MRKDNTDLFVMELYCEEIPARMQQDVGWELRRIVQDVFADLVLLDSDVDTEVGLHRMVVLKKAVPLFTQSRETCMRGPRIGAPDQAVDGFLRKVGLGHLPRDEALGHCIVDQDAYCYFKQTPSMSVSELLGPALSAALAQFSWSQSMRWDDSGLYWVRPLRNILCLLGEQVVPLKLGHVCAGRQTIGKKRVHDGVYGADHYKLAHANDYLTTMKAAHVQVFKSDREKTLRDQLEARAAQQGGQWQEDLGLLEEMVGLTESPVVYVGEIPRKYLDLPTQVLRTVLRKHQKYALIKDENGNLLPYFMFASPMTPPDGGKLMIEGNQRVLCARLEDAVFFVQQDRAQGWEAWRRKIDQVIWNHGLGTCGQKIQRLERIVTDFASMLGWSSAAIVQVQHAARLAKLDLVSAMVRELPELQGVMGGYYAGCAGVDPVVSQAIAEHYRPAGPSDALPNHACGALLACADKIDTIVGMFLVGNNPTSSGDPFAVRRACFGFIKIIASKKWKISIEYAVETAFSLYDFLIEKINDKKIIEERKDKCIDFMKKRIQ